MTEREALYRTICENPDDDTPRLVYADWLQENGEEARAEFIRVQCNLAKLPRSDPGWAECLVREQQLLDAHRHRVYARGDESWPEGVFPPGPRTVMERGFPAIADIFHIEGDRAFRERQFINAIRSLTELTPVRHVLMRAHLGLSDLDMWLGHEAFAGMTGLSLLGCDSSSSADPEEVAAGVRHLSDLRRFRVSHRCNDRALWELARPESPVSWEELELGLDEDVTSESIRKLLGRAGMTRLRGLTLSRDGPEDDFLSAVPSATLPELKVLRLFNLGSIDSPRSPPEASARSGCPFPKLESLHLGGYSLNHTSLGSFIAGLPVGELSFRSAEVRPEALRELGAEAGRNLRVLELWDTSFDASAHVMAEAPGFENLRSLTAWEAVMNPEVLKVLGSSGRLRGLRSLTLKASPVRRKMSRRSEGLESITLPNLSTLSLNSFPLGRAGAIALAKNACLSGLRSLSLSDCAITGRGAAALLASPYLRELEYLDLQDNGLRGGVEALAHPDILPRLGKCNLTGNRLPESVRAKLAGRPGVMT